jgi:hypothetical protein
VYLSQKCREQSLLTFEKTVDDETAICNKSMSKIKWLNVINLLQENDWTSEQTSNDNVIYDGEEFDLFEMDGHHRTNLHVLFLIAALSSFS